jgi:hypothetical protein
MRRTPNLPITVFKTREAAQKVVDGNVERGMSPAEIRVFARNDGRFVVEILDPAGRFVFCL